MPVGPGKYGAHAEAILKDVGGDLCLVLVLNGRDGPSFDCATSNPAMLALVPGVLRQLADSIAVEVQHDLDAIIFGDRKQ
jgi:hypothetical protein